MAYSDCPQIEAALEYQLINIHTNQPAKHDYRGMANLWTRNGQRHLTIGEAHQVHLEEFRIEGPTPESERAFEAVIAGVTAAIGDFKPARRQSSKGADWLRGYDEAIKYRKQVDKRNKVAQRVVKRFDER